MKQLKSLTIPTIATAALLAIPMAALQADTRTGNSLGHIQLAQQEAADISTETLELFVDAFIEIETIRNQVSQQLQSVETESDAQVLRQQAQDQMVMAVEQQGISVQEYNEVTTQMQNDPELLAQVQALANERR